MAQGDVESAQTPLVSILIFCAHPALAYGTLLIFKTLRIGFPTAQVEVFDNGSHPEVLAQIERAAADVGATFQALTPRHYADHLRWLLLEREHDGSPLVLLDPDVVFWSSVEGWRFGDALMAGRLMPQLGSGAVIGVPRLHPSLLWVPDVERLRVEAVGRSMGAAGDLVGQRAERVGDQVRTFDTTAALYQALSDQCVAFDEEHLDCYDHLFYGSHLPLLDAGLGVGFEKIRDGHRAAATGDLGSLRGIWRRQQEFFTTDLAVKERPGTPAAEWLASIKAIQQWQGLGFDDEGLREGFGHLLQAIDRPRDQSTQKSAVCEGQK